MRIASIFQVQTTSNFGLIAASSARAMSIQQARLKADQKSAHAYCFRFDWQTPVLDGRPMAQHGGDLAFDFDNTSRFENMTGDGPEARALAAKVSESCFGNSQARAGNPLTEQKCRDYYKASMFGENPVLR